MNILIKRISAAILVALILFSAAPITDLSGITAAAFSYTGSCGSETVWSLDSETGVLTISGTGKTDDIVPLNSPWNLYKDEIKSVIIEEDITGIGSHLFYGCTALSEISLPSSLTEIGTLAFENCFALEAITVADNNAYFYSDENGVLYNKDKTVLIQYPVSRNATSYDIPDGVNEIAESAFYGCNSLVSVSLPDSIIMISDNAFRSCENLVNISVPRNTVSIGNNAFRTTAIRSVTLSESVTAIGENAFGWCFDLKNIGVDENNNYFSSDEYGVLFNKEKSVLIKYPSNCNQISYFIPSTVTEIADNAFENCGNLQSVTVPASVNSIGSGVFFNCALKEISVNADNTKYSSDSFGVLYSKDKTELIQYPVASEKTSYKIPTGVLTVKESSFHNAKNLKNIVIDNGVKSIENEAFLYCSDLEFIHIPESVTEIGTAIINGNTTICSETENCFAKEYADLNGIGFTVCTDHGVSSITISENEIELLNKESYKLSATVTPDTAADKSVSWSSDNENVATVDSDGNVTAVSAGVANIIATATDGGYTAICKVTVTPRYFSITWITDGEETVDIIAEGDEITVPVPFKEGYTFDGWSADVPPVMPENDLTFTAKWSVNSYSAIFNANGGEWSDGSTVKKLSFDYNEEIYAPRTPEKTGYEFAGWTPGLGIMDSVSGKEFSAKWTPSADTKYVVETYSMNVDGTYSVSQEDYAGITDTTVNAEYTVETGFALNSEKSVLSGNIEPDGSLVLKVYIDRLSFKVNINGDNLDLLFGEEIGEPEKPTAPEGHIQQGWIDENGNHIEFPLIVGTDLPSCIEANFVKQSYTVEWIVDGNKSEEIYEFGAEIIKPESPEKTGYSFIGWTPDVPEAMPAGSLSFTAVWEANSYDAVFDANGGKWTDGGTKKTVATYFDIEIAVPEAPEKDGYIFSGWTPAVGVMDSINGKEFKAVWTASTDTRYTIETYTMNTDGEYSVIIQTLTGATDSEAKVVYSLEDGFMLNEENSILSGIITADNALVLKVYIDRKSYSVTTFSDGITTVTKYLFGAIIGELAAPEKEGYTFVGWNKTVPETMPAENLEFTAKYTKNSYICTDCGDKFDDESLYNEHLAYELSKKNIKVSIKNNPNSKTVNYGETLKLTAVTSATLPEGTSIFWYIDGIKKGEGQTFGVSFDSGTKTVEVKIVDESGKALKGTDGTEISDSEKVTVKAGFFQKLISFFKNLFGSDRTVIQ